MTSIVQINTSLVVQAWLSGACQTSIARLRQVEIELGQQFDRDLQRIRLKADLVREDTQNALDFLTFLNLQLAQSIIQFHNHQRLHKDGCATGRLIVYNTAHLPSALRLDGKHVAIIANGDNMLL